MRMENRNNSAVEGDQGKGFDSVDVENGKGLFLNVGDVSGAERVVTDDKCELDLD
eukprot:CAMPEP_0184740746 /NCGR_PEP_ID=MMETSP0315-20130426/3759_1 /TAXON_ID=101924 /ORGANISM="Rhodosorus marinus, Strain UTEX LB 2760" /LENGTH=54 /DNA_ID=CAMNT_0027210607 /DNA_START=100 /DNA_END=261 /DNA_ORIENTATION=+